MAVTNNSTHQPALASYRLKPNFRSISVDAPSLEPWSEILALAHIEGFQLVASSNDSINAGTSDANAASN